MGPIIGVGTDILTKWFPSYKLCTTTINRNFVHPIMVIEAPPNPKQTTGMFVLIILLLLVLLANRIDSVEYMMYGRLVEYLRARHLRPGALVPAHVAH